MSIERKLLNQNSSKLERYFSRACLLRTGGYRMIQLEFTVSFLNERALEFTNHCIEDSLIYHFRGSRSKKVESTGSVCANIQRLSSIGWLVH